MATKFVVDTDFLRTVAISFQSIGGEIRTQSGAPVAGLSDSVWGDKGVADEIQQFSDTWKKEWEKSAQTMDDVGTILLNCAEGYEGNEASLLSLLEDLGSDSDGTASVEDLTQ